MIIALRQWHFVCKMPGRLIAAPTISIGRRSDKLGFIAWYIIQDKLSFFVYFAIYFPGKIDFLDFLTRIC